MGPETQKLDLKQLDESYMNGWGNIWDGFRLAYMLYYLTSRYSNKIAIFQAYFQELKDNFGYLGGYIVGKKGSSTFFSQKKENGLINLCGSVAKTTGPTILWSINRQKRFYNLDRW